MVVAAGSTRARTLILLYLNGSTIDGIDDSIGVVIKERSELVTAFKLNNNNNIIASNCCTYGPVGTYVRTVARFLS